MSSNIRLKRICKYCEGTFIAKTTVTQYCGNKCAKRAYKARKRKEKIEHSEKEILFIRTKKIKEVQAKEILTVQDVASIIGCSKRTVYRLIEKNLIKSVNLGERMIRIHRSEIDKLMKINNNKKVKPGISEYKVSEMYSITEIQKKYGISEKGLYDIIKRNHIKKIKNGKYSYVQKKFIDELLT